MLRLSRKRFHGNYESFKVRNSTTVLRIGFAGLPIRVCSRNCFSDHPLVAELDRNPSAATGVEPLPFDATTLVCRGALTIQNVNQRLVRLTREVPIVPDDNELLYKT